jgi:hypothetical protein
MIHGVGRDANRVAHAVAAQAQSRSDAAPASTAA